MHTYNGNSCRIHYNSDMSGKVCINSKKSDKEITVDAQDILDFVANYVRSKRIARIEKMETETILMGTDDILDLK